MNLVRAVHAVLLLTALLLSGCGPETIRSTLFPLRYAVQTDIEVLVDGRRVHETFVQGCRIIDQSDSIAAITLTDVSGDTPWFATADGGVLIIGGMGPCRWWHEQPAIGTTGDPFEVSPAVMDTVTWRFDSARRPSRVDVYRAPDLFGSDGPLSIVSARLSVVKARPTHGLKRAFPGAAEFTRPSTRRGVEAGTRFVGVEGQVRPVRASEPCLDRVSGPIIMMPFCPFGRGDLDKAEAATIRPLVFIPVDNLDRFEIESAPPPGLKARLTRIEVPSGPVPIIDANYMAWRPEICVGELCARMPVGGMPFMQLYDGENGLIYEVRRTSHVFSSRNFGH